VSVTGPVPVIVKLNSFAVLMALMVTVTLLG
jgi:hypothetical protein